MTSAAAHASAPQAQGLVAAPVAAIPVPKGQSAGMLRAGLACLPSGRLTRGDFVADPTEMQQDLHDALAALDPARLAALPGGGKAALTIELREISTRLCNKSYGVFGRGDTRSLSGEARFLFGWKAASAPAGEPAGTVEIVLTPGKRDGATPRSLFREALARLAERLASLSSSR